MHKLKTLALVALAAFGLTARSAGVESTNNWWNVTFEDASFQDGFEGLTEGELGSLTNDSSTGPVVQPYAEGVWSMVDGDESYVTNSFNPTNAWKQFGSDVCVKLDTQGNDLTWTVEDNNQMDSGLKALVDADLYLVGSDSAPDASDFDAKSDVQTAVYLKNEIDPDSGETTNSVLCVYIFDPSLGSAGDNTWQELDGVELDDNAWAHVQVLVDHSNPEDYPFVKVYVNGTEMHARNGNPAEDNYAKWTAANRSVSQTTGKVSSVAFRGTGAVDNFVGQTISETFQQAHFKAEVYLDNQITNELCQVTELLDIGGTKPAEFTQYLWEEYDDESDCALYGLDKVEIIDFSKNPAETATYAFDYDPEGGTIEPMPETGPVSFYGEGFFKVSADTTGAPGPATPGEIITNVIVKIHFMSAGAHKANAETVIDGVCTTNSIVVKTNDLPATPTWEFPATKDGNVLSTIQVYNGAALAYANGKATVSVTISEALAADTLFVTATYAAGSLAEGYDLDPGEPVNGLYTFTAYKPPVAIRISADGTTTNECFSLREAIEDYAQEGDTIYLVQDDHVSFTEDEPEIMIADISLTIDGNGHTLYGLTDYGTSYHDIFIGPTAGNVTIKNLKFTEFGDTAAFSDMMTPIVTSGSYAGMLTLDGVTIDKFIRQAVLICGGDFLITNCTITGSTAGTEYFQSAIEVFNATGTVVNTTITGIGAKGKTFINPDTNEEDEWKAAVFTIDLAGFGKITVESGSYTGEFITSFNKETTGSIVLEGGTFVATAEAGQSAFLDDSETGSTLSISGGWFDREPAAAYVAAGLTVVQDADNAPDPAATWTVKAAAVQIEGDTTKSYLSIAEAQAAAATAGIDDPVFVIVAPLSAETVTLATAEDTLTVKTDDTSFLANLEVVTSLAGSDAVEYSVEPRALGMEPPITVTYMVVPTYYVAKIVDGATTNKYETFAEAAAAAAAADATLWVEMVASTNAVEIYGLPADYVLMVKKNGFLVPAVDSASRGHYVDESPADETGVTTYSSQPYLTATFLNGDGSVLETVDFLKAGDTPVPTKDDKVEPYPPAEPGYWVTHLYNWSPALAPIYEDTTFRPLFTTNVTSYSIQYTLDGGAWPAGYTPPEWYAVTNATITLPTPVKDGWTFNGWYTNKTDGAYVGDLVNPGTIPTGSYGPKFFYASWTENAVEVKVDAGDGLAEYKATHPDANVPEPIEFTDAATPLCELSFVTPEAGWYFLYTNATVNGTYTPDYTTKTNATKKALVTLTESAAGTTKFFKIGWSATDPEAD